MNKYIERGVSPSKVGLTIELANRTGKRGSFALGGITGFIGLLASLVSAIAAKRSETKLLGEVI